MPEAERSSQVFMTQATFLLERKWWFQTCFIAHPGRLQSVKPLMSGFVRPSAELKGEAEPHGVIIKQLRLLTRHCERDVSIGTN